MTAFHLDTEPWLPVTYHPPQRCSTGVSCVTSAVPAVRIGMPVGSVWTERTSSPGTSSVIDDPWHCVHASVCRTNRGGCPPASTP